MSEQTVQKNREDRLVGLIKNPTNINPLLEKIRDSDDKDKSIALRLVQVTLDGIKRLLEYVDGEHRTGFQVLDMMDFTMSDVDLTTGPADEPWTADQVDALVTG